MDILNRLSEDWNNLSEINVYGFGRVSQRNIGKLYNDFNIVTVIDNDKSIHGKDYHGLKIKNFVEAKEEVYKRKTIVATSSFAYDSISKQLKEAGLKEFIDFCRLEDFMPEWYWKNKKQVCLSQLFSSINSKCTFNCKHCNMLMPYFKEHFEYDADKIIKDFDALFERVDYLTSYFIIGGEPLLNKNLPDIITAVAEKYGNKIGYIQVITNGSVIPNEKLIDVIIKYGVNIRISDYTHQIQYNTKLQQVKDTLKANNIPYSMSIYETWMDLTFPEKFEPDWKTVDDFEKHMLNCSPGCHCMDNQKIYYCGLMVAAEKCGFYKLKPGDYVDLSQSNSSLELDKRELLEYFLGKTKNRYISICNLCRGTGTDNSHIIGVAEQMER